MSVYLSTKRRNSQSYCRNWKHFVLCVLWERMLQSDKKMRIRKPLGILNSIKVSPIFQQIIDTAWEFSVLTCSPCDWSLDNRQATPGCTPCSWNTWNFRIIHRNIDSRDNEKLLTNVNRQAWLEQKYWEDCQRVKKRMIFPHKSSNCAWCKWIGLFEVQRASVFT